MSEVQGPGQIIGKRETYKPTDSEEAIKFAVIRSLMSEFSSMSPEDMDLDKLMQRTITKMHEVVQKIRKSCSRYGSSRFFARYP
ncbi:hypothetical protein LRY60_04860 [Candidatus Woesebacteria bacterium]|nr:hypothetical protein [Candidatus Woesebacteria bacterium]